MIASYQEKFHLLFGNGEWLVGQMVECESFHIDDNNEPCDAELLVATAHDFSDHERDFFDIFGLVKQRIDTSRSHYNYPASQLIVFQ